ncbi:hypothetical protein MHUMG1_07661 [Metarhizium humberi]|uniref:Major facilitator superfamily domain, general substrate transporter n=1 Tax=Metarhizium humberi TaxID=2596975 RepID=A0A9P8S4R3_9HYPO|nr:hypothetical protein MHUMG1_07661 [Metarhizium humberi]
MESRQPSDDSREADSHHINSSQTSELAAECGKAAATNCGESCLQFDPQAEKKLRLKIDLYVVPSVAVIFLFCAIDRTNLGNARIAGLEADLGFTGYNYSEIMSIFYLSYILFEIPANLLCKSMGPGWFLPVATIFFGAVSLATAYVHNFAQMAGVRLLLGFFEAGILPGSPLAGAFGGLISSAILTLDSFVGLYTWRMIFAIEGILTICVGFIVLFTLTDRPETARWLSQGEKELALARVKSERVGQIAVLDKIDKKKLLRGITSPVTISMSFLFLLNNITVQSLAFFLPTIVRTIYRSHTTVQQQLLTAPPYLVGVIFMLPLPFLSWRYDRRQIFLMLSAPAVILGYCMFLGSKAQAVRYSATFILAATVFAQGPLCNAQVSANVVGDTARSAAIGINVMMGNTGGLISSWAFLPWDAPDFRIGNGLNLATATTFLVVASLTLVWMKRDNKAREQRNAEEELRDLSQEEIEDLDWKHPEFRWKP